MPTLRDQLMKIAKRGRKRYLGLTFVTQSPNDLPDDVLGLVNNWVIYKIDEATIAKAEAAASASVDPHDDIHASGAYRKALIGVMVERALKSAAA